MPGLLCRTRLLASRLAADRACQLPCCRYSLAPSQIIASHKLSSVQQWLPAQTQVDEADSAAAADDDDDNEEEEEEEEAGDDDDDDDDLADMVHDFIENGSGTWRRNNGFLHIVDSGSDSDNGSSLVPSCCELLQVIMEAMVPEENKIASHLAKLLLNAGELDLWCRGEKDCNGGCLNLLAMKHLRVLGYHQATICQSKWQSNGKHPGGEYEFINISLKGEEKEKVIVVDLDFRSQFEIARPVMHYSKALRWLPLIFVGGEGRLDWVLRVMSDAARGSLHQTCMSLPPWWRPIAPDPAPSPETVPFPPPHCHRHGHCRTQLNRLKQEVAKAQKGQTLVDITGCCCSKPGACLAIRPAFFSCFLFLRHHSSKSSGVSPFSDSSASPKSADHILISDNFQLWLTETPPSANPSLYYAAGSYVF